MSSKRARLAAAAQMVQQPEEETSAPAESAVPALADEIRAAIMDQAFAQKRSAFVDAKLKQMPEAELTRFEFFVRSHFNRSAVRRVMQNEVDKVRMANRGYPTNLVWSIHLAN